MKTKEQMRKWAAILPILLVIALFYFLSAGLANADSYTYTLSGGPSSETPLVVDDDLEVKVNGKTVLIDNDGVSTQDGRATWKGAPITFSASPSDTLRIIATNPGGVDIELSSLYLHVNGQSLKLSDGVPKTQSDVYEFFNESFTISLLTPLVSILDYSPSPVHGGADLNVKVSWSNIPVGWKLVVSLEESEGNITRLTEDVSKVVSGSGEETFKLKVYLTKETHGEAKVCACFYNEKGEWTGIFDKKNIIVYPKTSITIIPTLIFGIIALIILITGIFVVRRKMTSNTKQKPSRSRKLNRKTLSELSKLMAYILRHDKKQGFPVDLDENCYAKVDQLVKAISSIGKWRWINRKHIEEVAAKSFYRGKRRFVITGDKIKAAYRITRKCPSTPTPTPTPKPMPPPLPFKENTYYVIIAKHSGKCLDVNSKSKEDGVMIQQFRYMSGDNQKWKLKAVGGGYYRIIAKHSGKCLDVSGISKNNGAKIIQYPYWGGDNQKWKLEPVGNGYYRIIAKHSGKCLDVNSKSKEDGVMIQQFRYMSGDNQKWKLKSAEGKLSEPRPLVAVSIERTIYDPCERDFISPRSLARMREWINRYDPGAYWFAVSIQNNIDRAIEEWGVELETSSALKIEEAKIEGIEREIPHETHLKSFKISVPKEYGIVIPKGGAQRVYFKLRAEKPKTTYEISGVFKSAISGDVLIRAKEFKYLCDTGMSPEAVKAELKKTFSEKEAARLALSFKTVQEIDRMCNQDTKTEEYLDKLSVLKNYTGGFSENFTKQVDEFSRFMEQEQLGYLDDKYKGKVRRFCTNLVDVWINEFL
ncbi:MAG: RICIN domain-containing protein [Halobacteriota archaeon]